MKRDALPKAPETAGEYSGVRFFVGSLGVRLDGDVEDVPAPCRECDPRENRSWPIDTESDATPAIAIRRRKSLKSRLE